MLFCENESNPPFKPNIRFENIALHFFLKPSQNTPITKHSKLDENISHLVCFQLRPSKNCSQLQEVAVKAKE
jgi:hypothetical protein